MMIKEDNYDSRYSKKEFYWGLKPHNLVVNSIEYLPSNAKVLDLGCGEGRNSLFLAKKGFQVTSVDISKVGIRKLQNLSKKEKINLEATVSNIDSYLNNCKKFDAIYCMNVLQFINKKDIFPLIDKIKSKTKLNGFFASFIAENKKQKDIVLSKEKYFFDEGELKDIYRYWKIPFYEEKLGEWETHGEPRHRHFKVRLIAQK